VPAVTALMIAFAYLLGSVPIGYLFGYFAGIDVRQAGSGNVGATNIARVVGRRQGILTLAGDAAKGFVAVVAALFFGIDLFWTAVVGAAAFLGHLYPVFLKFRGGKGVATALGVLLGLAPAATLILIGVFCAVVLTTRIVSMGSVVGATVAPLMIWIFPYPPQLVALSIFLAVMILIRHRSNIQRLLAGTEPRFDTSSSR
jgi:glycerol-3-phosphate acyltransferase PlsY